MSNDEKKTDKDNVGKVHVIGEHGSCAIKDGTRLATLAIYDVVSGRKIGECVI